MISITSRLIVLSGYISHFAPPYARLYLPSESWTDTGLRTTKHKLRSTDDKKMQLSSYDQHAKMKYTSKSVSRNNQGMYSQGSAHMISHTGVLSLHSQPTNYSKRVFLDLQKNSYSPPEERRIQHCTRPGKWSNE